MRQLCYNTPKEHTDTCDRNFQTFKLRKDLASDIMKEDFGITETFLQLDLRPITLREEICGLLTLAFNQ